MGAIFEVMIDGKNFGEVGPTTENGTITIDYDTYGLLARIAGLSRYVRRSPLMDT